MKLDSFSRTLQPRHSQTYFHFVIRLRFAMLILKGNGSDCLRAFHSIDLVLIDCLD